jgi:hypothetical protein
MKLTLRFVLVFSTMWFVSSFLSDTMIVGLCLNSIAVMMYSKKIPSFGRQMEAVTGFYDKLNSTLDAFISTNAIV